MTVPIDTTTDDFFTVLVSLLNPVLNLRKREADILTAFLRIHYVNRHDPMVNQKLFSSQILKSIRESLGMTTPSFNNHKFRMRKKEIFLKRSINPLITNAYPKEGKLNICFQITIRPSTKPNTTTNAHNTNTSQVSDLRTHLQGASV